ncbi:MAG: hypothetical protein IKM02_00830, partial [Clostridia bacterium]|nr:hypothetical protein [Clostridia bacterium]
IFNTRISVHPLMLLMIPLACRLGQPGETAAAICALTVHEAAHLAAARAVHVSIPELRLMPFGGSARIGNPYALAPWQLCVIAAAGPLSNLFLIFLSAAFAQWNLIVPESAFLLLRINLLLMLFNLLPALPLDGGRMMYAILFRYTGPEKALALGIRTGRLLAAILMTGTLILYLERGVFNLSYLFSAFFLIASGAHERAALAGSGVHTLIAALSPVTEPVPVSVTAVSSACTVQRALRAAKPNTVNLYAVYTEGTLTGVTDDRSLLELCLSASPREPVGNALESNPTAQKNPSGSSD